MGLIVYTKTGCPWCAEVLDFLRYKKIAFEERNVLENPNYMQELVEKSAQDKTPTLDLDGKILADTDVEAVVKFLNL